MNSLEMGRENEHRRLIVQKIHDKAQLVSKSLAEMGGRSSGLTPYMVLVWDEE